MRALLSELVESVRAILGETFCGAYLQGSFALGAGDEHSDVDWIVATHGEVDAFVPELQAMHARLYALETPWAQHLEGSYVPVASLRRLDPGRSYWFLDNGASELEVDPHCNTQVVRWLVRERGITLAGPDPTTLIDPVSGNDLRAEMLAGLDEWVEYSQRSTKAGGMSRWLQPYVVLSFCRMLCTIGTGEVRSKSAAAEWAVTVLAPEWSPLIRQALADRPDPWGRVYQKADPATIERTHAFVAYAVAVARARTLWL